MADELEGELVPCRRCMTAYHRGKCMPYGMLTEPTELLHQRVWLLARDATGAGPFTWMTRRVAHACHACACPCQMSGVIGSKSCAR